jgi:hypothetical protein
MSLGRVGNILRTRRAGGQRAAIGDGMKKTQKRKTETTDLNKVGA